MRGIVSLRRQLAHLSLLALILGRRAVIPMVPCEIPVAELPGRMRAASVIIKLAEPHLCSASSRSVTWRLPPHKPPLHTHLAIQTTPEMGAFANYKGVPHTSAEPAQRLGIGMRLATSPTSYHQPGIPYHPSLAPGMSHWPPYSHLLTSFTHSLTCLLAHLLTHYLLT